MSSDGQLWAAPFGFELPDLYIPEVTMPAIRASLPCRDLSSSDNTGMRLRIGVPVRQNFGDLSNFHIQQ